MTSRHSRIRTTHAGSLPRPHSLVDHVLDRQPGADSDATDMRHELAEAVAGAVSMQVEAGIDVINDGELSKASYMTYATERLAGFGATGSLVEATSWLTAALAEHPDFAATLQQAMAPAAKLRVAACDGPISYNGHTALTNDLTTLLNGCTDAGVDGSEAFMSAASPGIVALFSQNHYYATEEDYLLAIADAMRNEYEAIYRAGLTVQLDCPDLAMIAPGFTSLDEFRAHMRIRIEAINHAVADIPAESVRLHVCWGGGEQPRTTDVELKDIIDILLTAKPAGLLLMASNARHAHEWTVFKDVALPPGKYLVPGVVDSSSNVVEHPELVAQRLVNYASVIGRENVMAGADCGFSNIAGMQPVVPSVIRAKFHSMVHGARLASEQLWPTTTCTE